MPLAALRSVVSCFELGLQGERRKTVEVEERAP